ncbi:MAG TPA: septum formation initiator family protein [Ginsengibacter sp.]|nr:septum formation initiator family protein [Chitinophagaceae bacterium]HRN72539.1 septum formation initiator family protein [Ginsengibacter sp.]HRP44615.1 septum formation initiator family protein [Ginsengibacter sp.]
MKYLKRIIANKYLLTLVAFVIWMFFFDRNDVPTQINRIQELNDLENAETSMTRQISDTRKELESLKSSPEMLEKYAREKYLMKKPNEDLFVVETVNEK